MTLLLSAPKRNKSEREFCWVAWAFFRGAPFQGFCPGTKKSYKYHHQKYKEKLTKTVCIESIGRKWFFGIKNWAYILEIIINYANEIQLNRKYAWWIRKRWKCYQLFIFISFQSNSMENDEEILCRTISINQ